MRALLEACPTLAGLARRDLGAADDHTSDLFDDPKTTKSERELMASVAFGRLDGTVLAILCEKSGDLTELVRLVLLHLVSARAARLTLALGSKKHMKIKVKADNAPVDHPDKVQQNQSANVVDVPKSNPLPAPASSSGKRALRELRAVFSGVPSTSEGLSKVPLTLPTFAGLLVRLQVSSEPCLLFRSCERVSVEALSCTWPAGSNVVCVVLFFGLHVPR